MSKFGALAVLLSLAASVASTGAENAGPATSGEAASSPVRIFAAASLKDALDAAAAIYKAKTGAAPSISYAGSMTLAKQIEAGAPADLFIAADLASMEYLAERKLVETKSLTKLFANKLVLIAPRSSKLDEVALDPKALAAAIGAGRIVTGDIASVPVGRYAKAAFETLGLWSAAEPHFAFTENVRGALVFVAREEAPLGVVYFTDARSEPKVKIVATFPANSHPPIVYPAALTSTAKGAEPANFLAFLKGAEAKAAFIERGFSPPP